MNAQPESLGIRLTGNPLRAQVQRAMVQNAQQDTRRFLPNSELLRLITPGNVRQFLSELETDCSKFRNKHSEIVNYVCGLGPRASRPARRVFTILLIMSEPHLILDFLETDIYDDSLPTSQTYTREGDHGVTRTDGSLINVFERWTSAQTHAFEKSQWCVCVPEFSCTSGKCVSVDLNSVRRLHNCAILPWIEQTLVYDNNCEVHRVKIHPAHHCFNSDEFAVKIFKSNVLDSDQEFSSELKAFRKVRPGRHIAELLTTFSHKDKYHMLFRWADGRDLRNMWRTLRPNKTYNQLCWFAEQCYGLADGLNGIHDTRSVSTAQITSDLDPSSKDTSDSGYLPAREDEIDGKFFGRHGDLKPDNILWFATDPNAFRTGVLKISDFGLAAFHSTATSSMNSKRVPYSLAYGAPEIDLEEDISRSYDIWSLGCVFLEFVTWLLLGLEGLDEFTNMRFEEVGARKKWKIDNFFIVVRDHSGKHAEVKSSVSKWISKLKTEAKGYTFLSEFLEVIENDMIVSDKAQRLSCQELTNHLKRIYERALREPSYALTTI